MDLFKVILLFTLEEKSFLETGIKRKRNQTKKFEGKLYRNKETTDKISFLELLSSTFFICEIYFLPLDGFDLNTVQN